MKLTGLPVYLVAICLSLYLLTLTFLNLINIASKLNSNSEIKNIMYKVCEDSFYNDKNVLGEKPEKWFLMSTERQFYSNCFEILTK